MEPKKEKKQSKKYWRPKKVILSRTDNLGDVMLTLPMAGWLKARYPEVRIYFLGKTYTQPLINACTHIDMFLDRDQLLKYPETLENLGVDTFIHVLPDREIAKLAQKAHIPLRIGTSHRLFHWLTCNHRVHLGRKNSDLHEAQLNMRLLEPLGLEEIPDLSEIPALYGFNRIAPLNNEMKKKLETKKFKLIIHPKSKGSAREWGLSNYLQLVNSLDSERFRIFVSGTEEEGKQIHRDCPQLFENKAVMDMTGQLNLTELIAFIHSSDGLLACSTGPLHIAAALGKNAWGLYPPIRPMHPGRWQAIGKKAEIFCLQKSCSACKAKTLCHCIESIETEQLKKQIMNALPAKNEKK
jgi:heptosyltransferase III